MTDNESPSKICITINGSDVYVPVPKDKPLLLDIKQYVTDAITGLVRVKPYTLCAKAAGGVSIR